MRIARKKAGLTQKDLADKLGITASAITQIEKGLTMPDINRVSAIADILKISVDELFRGKNEKIKPTLRPLIGSASCGVPTTYYYDDVEMISAPDGFGGHSYYVRADGDSMETDIPDGALVLCDPDAEVVSGKIVHYTWDGECGIKKYLDVNGQVVLQPTNQSYPPIIVTDAYELRMARVVFVGKFL